MGVEERIKKLQERKAAIDAEIQKIKARTQKEDRKKDTRRKILIGGIIMKLVKDGVEGWSSEKLKLLLDRELTRDDDRALFDLSSKNEDRN